MKTRIRHLISVLSLVADAPNASDARSLILQWILDEADRSGGNKHRIRRNLIWSNHVRGKDATTKFAALVWNAAANEQHDALVSIVRATSDEQALRAHLVSLAPQTTLSARWIHEQVATRDLDRRLTHILLSRAHMPFNELRSLVGVWLGRWGTEGTFDEVIEATGSVRIGVMVDFLRGKVRSHHFRRGTEPLERMRGARTECEVTHRRQNDDPTYITRGAERTDNDAPDTATAFDEDGEVMGVDFIDRSESPEESTARNLDTEQQINMLREMTRINHGKAGDRFVRFFDLHAKGLTFDEMALIEGVSRDRAKKIVTEIRTGLRISISREQAAKTILRAIEDEPFSTADEIEADLQIEADVVAECLHLLCRSGEVTEAPGQSYVLTRNL